MAGAGYKLFNTGDVLTAAQVNTYLMEQTVMVFADAAARTAALSGVVSEGMISYLKDTNAVEVYNGSAWVASDDPNAIQNTIVDAKGDLIAASAADTPARLAVGNNGETLVADSSASTGLRWQPDFSVGRNKIINGDFNINQRAFTSITQSSPSATYTFDRFQITHGGTAGYSITWTPQTFALGTAPVAGYEGKNFLQIATASYSNNDSWGGIAQPIEGVRTLANQTITVSFWAKADSGTPKIGLRVQQAFGDGGSPSSAVNKYATINAISTSWARYSATFTLDSLSGKTIGTDGRDRLTISLVVTAGSSTFEGAFGSMLQNNTFQIWGLQVEAGSVATPFTTATGTLAGEFAAACRYYYRMTSNNGDAYMHFFNGLANTTSNFRTAFAFAVPMRVAPTSVDYGGSFVISDGASTFTGGAVTLQGNGVTNTGLNIAATGLTQFRPYLVYANNSTSTYIGFSAEL